MPTKASRGTRPHFRLWGRVFAVIAVGVCITGCPSKQDKPIDLIKNRRETYEKAKQVEQAIDQSTRKRMEEADR